ncbi:hypothetical protein IID19_02330 [Patescibacteria group bacterium]|nr:hypothetical protein [Patescibacteria group bacterium]
MAVRKKNPRKKRTTNKSTTKPRKPAKSKTVTGAGTKTLELDLTLTIKGSIKQSGDAQLNLGSLADTLASVLPMFQKGAKR